MLNYENFAVTLGRAVELFRRGPDAVPEQKIALRTLTALVRLGGVVVEVVDGELHLDGVRVAVTLPGVRMLLTQLESHDVRVIRIAQGAAPAGLLDLLRGLAVPFGGFSHGEDPGTRLRAAGVTDIEVVVQPPRRVTPDAGRGASAPVAVPDAAGPPPARISRPEAAVASLALEPGGDELGDRLAAAADGIREELQHGRPSGAVRAVAQLLQLAEAASEEPAAALRGAVEPLMTRALFEGALECTRAADSREAAERVLRAGGGVATEAVRDRLLDATSPEDQLHYLALLRQQTEGVRYVILLLQHRDPEMVRRTAEVVGALGLREAVPLLERMALHPDPAVRAAVLRALARLATPQAIQTLEQMLREPAADVRAAVGRALAGPALGVLVPVIDRAGRRERHPEALAEFGRALGRIGTPEAVTVLTRWVQPPGWRFWRRNVERRLAAVDGLQCAGGGGAVGVLRGLTHDRDPDVQRAATEALEDLSIAARPRHP